ncbi:hypothetical protein Pelo_10568 [Pelomyxa schiedti]|nr:hypothetical protein Pelo_10568 [Pelomyxa schiedti]
MNMHGYNTRHNPINADNSISESVENGATNGFIGTNVNAMGSVTSHNNPLNGVVGNSININNNSMGDVGVGGGGANGGGAAWSQKRESRTSEFIRRACGNFCKRYRSKQVLNLPTETASKVYRAVYTYTAESLARVGLLRIGVDSFDDSQNQQLFQQQHLPQLPLPQHMMSVSSRQRATYGLCEAFHGSNQGVNKSPWCLLASVDVSDSAYTFRRAFVINEIPGGVVFIDRALSPILPRKRIPIGAAGDSGGGTNLSGQQPEQQEPQPGAHEPQPKHLKSVPSPAASHVPVGSQSDLIHKLTVENEFLRQQVTYLASLAGVSHLFSPPAPPKVPQPLPYTPSTPPNKESLPIQNPQSQPSHEQPTDIPNRPKCPICLEEKTEAMMWKLGCNHDVCSSCMKEFARRILNGADNKCPICRVYFDDTYLQPFLTEYEMQQLQSYRDAMIQVAVSRASCGDFMVDPAFSINMAWKRCPQCNSSVQRDMTNHLCCGCKTEFCFLCGLVLSPSHDNACVPGCQCWVVHFAANGPCPLFCDSFDKDDAKCQAASPIMFYQQTPPPQQIQPVPQQQVIPQPQLIQQQPPPVVQPPIIPIAPQYQAMPPLPALIPGRPQIPRPPSPQPLQLQPQPQLTQSAQQVQQLQPQQSQLQTQQQPPPQAQQSQPQLAEVQNTTAICPQVFQQQELLRNQLAEQQQQLQLLQQQLLEQQKQLELQFASRQPQQQPPHQDAASKKEDPANPTPSNQVKGDQAAGTAQSPAIPNAPASPTPLLSSTPNGSAPGTPQQLPPTPPVQQAPQPLPLSPANARNDPNSSPQVAPHAGPIPSNQQPSQPSQQQQQGSHFNRLGWFG